MSQRAWNVPSYSSPQQGFQQFVISLPLFVGNEIPCYISNAFKKPFRNLKSTKGSRNSPRPSRYCVVDTPIIACEPSEPFERDVDAKKAVRYHTKLVRALNGECSISTQLSGNTSCWVSSKGMTMAFHMHKQRVKLDFRSHGRLQHFGHCENISILAILNCWKSSECY